MGRKWDRPPPASAEAFLAEALEGHRKVKRFEQEKPQVWRVERYAMDEVRFYFQDVYTFGLADYEAVRRQHPDIRCIVTAGSWNHFTTDAAERAHEDGVALFDYSALFGALNKDGEAFYRHGT